MKRRRRQRGVAAIEFGLLLPLFCVLLFGLIDYGYYFLVDLAATNAVREGARAATTIAGACPNGAAVSEGTTAIGTYLTNVGLGSLSRTVSVTCATVSGDPRYQFQLVVNFQRLTGFPWVSLPAASAGFGADYTSVTTTATMRGE